MCDFGNMGGAGDGVYNNGFNTPGMGDVVVPGNETYGSGDLFTQFGGIAQKRSTPKKQRTTTGNMDPRPLIVSVAGRTGGSRKKTSVKKPK